MLARALNDELKHKLWSFWVFQDVKLYLCPCVYHHFARRQPFQWMYVLSIKAKVGWADKSQSALFYWFMLKKHKSFLRTCFVSKNLLATSALTSSWFTCCSRRIYRATQASRQRRPGAYPTSRASDFDWSLSRNNTLSRRHNPRQQHGRHSWWIWICRLWMQ